MRRRQIDVGRVPVLYRPSLIASKHVGTGTRTVPMASLEATGIRSADPATGVFQACSLGFASARATAMAACVEGSNREMEPPPGFASTPMHAFMPRGQPRPATPNGAPQVVLSPFGRPCAHLQPSAPSAPRLLTAAPTPWKLTAAPAPPPPRFGVRPPWPHVGATTRPPPQARLLSNPL
jgi:hypothetical protein